MKRLCMTLLAVLTVWVAQAQTMKGSTVVSLERQGMVDVQTVDSTIRVSLMYARSDNFCGEILYGDLCRAYLHPEAAKALARAQRELRRLHPDLSLVVFDAARPMAIQQRMWDKVKNTRKNIYVSNPAHGGGLHNYGLAVDISICNEKGDTLDMGTKVDYMGPAAHTDREEQLVRQGRISRQAMLNRRLLRRVMSSAGFRQLKTEWWHYNLKSRAEARQRYKVLE